VGGKKGVEHKKRREEPDQNTERLANKEGGAGKDREEGKKAMLLEVGANKESQGSVFVQVKKGKGGRGKEKHQQTEKSQ